MIYYGVTPYGKKTHIGNWLSPRHTRREQWVYTFCGSEMSSWSDSRPERRANEYCRNCLRQFAWALVVAHFDNQPPLALEDVYADLRAPGMAFLREQAVRHNETRLRLVAS